MTVTKEVPGEVTDPQHLYGHILVALDGSALAERVLDYVEPLARTFGSEVTILCAVEPISSMVLAEISTPGVYGATESLHETREQIQAEDAAYLEDGETSAIGAHTFHDLAGAVAGIAGVAGCSVLAISLRPTE